MESKNFESLSLAVNHLTKNGYTESFKAGENKIIALNSKKEYSPEKLKITESYRFDGMTNPSDESELFAIVANDGTKGSLVMSYSADHSQNVELIRQIEKKNKIT